PRNHGQERLIRRCAPCTIHPAGRAVAGPIQRRAANSPFFTARRIPAGDRHACRSRPALSLRRQIFGGNTGGRREHPPLLLYSARGSRTCRCTCIRCLRHGHGTAECGRKRLHSWIPVESGGSAVSEAAVTAAPARIAGCPGPAKNWHWLTSAAEMAAEVSGVWPIVWSPSAQ